MITEVYEYNTNASRKTSKQNHVNRNQNYVHKIITTKPSLKKCQLLTETY